MCKIGSIFFKIGRAFAGLTEIGYGVAPLRQGWSSDPDTGLCKAARTEPQVKRVGTGQVNIFKRSMIGLVFVSVAGSPTTASAPCMERQEHEALQMRFEQSQRMVAALSCFGSDKSLLQTSYNDFVRRNADSLKQTTVLLRSYLHRTKGPSLDLFVTDLANDMSLEVALTHDFCRKAVQATKALRLIGTSNDQDVSLPVNMSQLPLPKACPDTQGAKNRTFASTEGMKKAVQVSPGRLAVAGASPSP